MFSLETSIVVIAAKQFNPSVFGELWLNRNGIITEQDPIVTRLFSDGVVQVTTSRFAFSVIPPQLQFAPTSIEDAASLVSEKVGRIVEQVPHTPFTGIGMNFIWSLKPKSAQKLGRNLFLNPHGPFAEVFSSEDCFFGGYFSKDALGCRLKLDIKPQVREVAKAECLVFSFNFHVPLLEDESKVQKITDHLRNWQSAYEMSQDIVERVSAEESDK